MHSVLFDPKLDHAGRRIQIYDGQLVSSATHPNSLAREAGAHVDRGAFGKLDPETAQYNMPVEKYAALLAELKPKFIHHPESKRCIQGMMRELGCDLDITYFDVPRMRTATSEIP